MTIPQRVRRIIRDLNLGAHLAIHTGESIIASIRHIWCRDPRNRPPLRFLPALAKAIKYYVAGAIDARDSFAIDGDTRGRRPSQLHPTLRRQRRELADRRRRLVTMLLHTLGETADAVEASLTRHWQITGDDDIPFGLVEDYLAARLRHRDPHALIYVDVFAWACCIGGTLGGHTRCGPRLPAPRLRTRADAALDARPAASGGTHPARRHAARRNRGDQLITASPMRRPSGGTGPPSRDRALQPHSRRPTPHAAPVARRPSPHRPRLNHPIRSCQCPRPASPPSRLDELSMGRIVREIDRGIRTIDNLPVIVTELVWDDAGRSFDAHLTDGTLLTELESFDTAPEDAQLLNLLDEHRGRWRCPGCHTTVTATEQDLVADHLRDCADPAGGQA